MEPPNEDIEKKYLELRKYSKLIENDYKKVVLNEDYSESDWKKDGRKINLNIKYLENTLRIIKEKIEKEKENNNDDDLQEIEKYTIKVEEEIIPFVKKIKEKTQYFR